MSQSDQAAQARIAELEQQLATVTDRLAQADDHIAIACHPELGWAVPLERYEQLHKEHEELKDALRAALTYLPDTLQAQISTQFGVVKKQRIPSSGE